MNGNTPILDILGPNPERAYRAYLCGIEQPATWQRAGGDIRALLACLGDGREDFAAGADSTVAASAAISSRDPVQLVYHAPLGLIEGAWLQGTTRIAHSGEGAVAALLRAYLELLGDDAGRSPAHRFRGLLAHAGISLPSPRSQHFGALGGKAAFALGSIQLALSFGQPRYFPELLGYSLGYVRSKSSWRLAGLEPASRSAVLQSVAREVDAAVTLYRHNRRDDDARIQLGLQLYLRSEAEYLAALAPIRQERDLEQQIAAIFADKAKLAAHYHGQIMLGDRPLRDWLSADCFDATGFLAAFTASDWVAGAHGDRPFDRLTAFGGRMFGVFSGDELERIKLWLDSRAATGNSPESVHSHAEKESFVAPPPQHPDEDLPGLRSFLGKIVGRAGIAMGGKRRETDYSDTDAWISTAHSDAPAPPRAIGTTPRSGMAMHRQLFHSLLNQREIAESLGLAHRLVQRELGAAGRMFWEPPRSRYFPYSPPAFRQRIGEIHRRQFEDGARPAARPRLGREQLAWGLLQMAPAVLVDGCWLQYACLAEDQASPTRRPLLRICTDELGCGNPAWNHSAIYRTLLESLGFAVAPTESLEFARSRLFLDAAFRLPAYLLAIGHFPRSFFPEILGLNLAIELSGLGRPYHRLAEAMEFWGIDATIIRLHQSIDNLASGHAALAFEAIQLHLDAVRTDRGAEEQAHQWRRVWTGFRSLECLGRRLKYRLLLGYLREFQLPGGSGGNRTGRQSIPSAAAKL